MRLTNTGNLGIGTSSFNGTYPEKLLVDAGTTTSIVNAIVGKGSINSYLQLNIQIRLPATTPLPTWWQPPTTAVKPPII